MIKKLINICLGLAFIATGFHVLNVKSKFELNPVKDIAPHVVPWKSSLSDRISATGFHIEYNGKFYILTNQHVCVKHDNSLPDNIRFGDYVGKIIVVDTDHDLCLVTSNRNSGLKIADEWYNEDMDEIVLVGYPRGIGKTIRYGHIITKKSWVAPWIGNFPIDTYQISTPAYPGNSGSPLVNKKGEVVGVLFAGHPYYPLEPFMVPLEAIQSFLLLHAK